MSDISFVEKKKFEQLLGMSSGYVLDFSNRTFAEFILDSTGLDIYNSRFDYGSSSKANRLRAFWLKESNATVGKLMSDMLDYCDGPAQLKEICRLVVARLLGTNHTPLSNAYSDGAHGSLSTPNRSQTLESLKGEYCRLATMTDRSRAGLELEKLLNRLFEAFQLKPRQPFRVVGEQIDGSFELDGEIYLLESKWEASPIREDQLLVFRGKIEGKSAFTRGVFIALNGITREARDAITRGKAPSFFVMDGYDLMMILGEAAVLTDFLRTRVRLLAEQGLVSVPFSEL